MPRSFVATSPTEIDRLGGLWRSQYRPAVHTLFQSFEWNLLAARCFRGEQPHVIAVEEGAGAAILPACLAEGRLSFLGDSLFDYRDLLADSPECAAAAWSQLSEVRRPFDLTALRGADAEDRWRTMGFNTAPFCNAPAVRRADVDAVEFESRHHRSARLLRRLSRGGVSFHERTPEPALLRAIYEAKAAQVVDTGENLFTEPARRDFLIAAAALGGCDVFTFETAGALVAALVTFRDGEVRRFYTIYYDRAWAHYSPGVALLFEVTRRTLAAGLDCDYMTGEQPHKVRFATSSVPLYRVSASAAELADSAAARALAA
ncbi:MAG: GNAT family N-acetyltransferase [Terriglobales bacterium]